jgi:hypothetical protein
MKNPRRGCLAGIKLKRSKRSPRNLNDNRSGGSGESERLSGSPSSRFLSYVKRRVSITRDIGRASLSGKLCIKTSQPETQGLHTRMRRARRIKEPRIVAANDRGSVRVTPARPFVSLGLRKG